PTTPITTNARPVQSFATRNCETPYAPRSPTTKMKIVATNLLVGPLLAEGANNRDTSYLISTELHIKAWHQPSMPLWPWAFLSILPSASSPGKWKLVSVEQPRQGFARIWIPENQPPASNAVTSSSA